MKTTILRTDLWKDEELYKLNMDSKFLYLYVLSNPERGNSRIFMFNKREASLWTGMTVDQIETAFVGLVDRGFVSIYNGYIAILKEHFSVTKNRYSDEQEAKDLQEMPEDIYAYFVDKKPIQHQEKKAKKPQTENTDEVKKFITTQNVAVQKALSDFVQDRIDRKRTPTVGAVKQWVNKLGNMYPSQYDKQVLCLEQSIERGWTGLFEVKNNDRTSESREFM